MLSLMLKFLCDYLEVIHLRLTDSLIHFIFFIPPYLSVPLQFRIPCNNDGCREPYRHNATERREHNYPHVPNKASLGKPDTNMTSHSLPSLLHSLELKQRKDTSKQWSPCHFFSWRLSRLELVCQR